MCLTSCLTISGAHVVYLIVAFCVPIPYKVAKWFNPTPRRNFLMTQNRAGGFFTAKRNIRVKSQSLIGCR